MEYYGQRWEALRGQLKLLISCGPLWNPPTNILSRSIEKVAQQIVQQGRWWW